MKHYDKPGDRVREMAIEGTELLARPERQPRLILPHERGLGYTFPEEHRYYCLVSQPKDIHGDIICNRIFPLDEDVEDDACFRNFGCSLVFYQSISAKAEYQLIYAPPYHLHPDKEFSEITAIKASIGNWGTLSRDTDAGKCAFTPDQYPPISTPKAVDMNEFFEIIFDEDIIYDTWHPACIALADNPSLVNEIDWRNHL